MTETAIPRLLPSLSRAVRRRMVLAGLALALPLLSVLAVGSGALAVPPGRVAAALLALLGVDPGGVAPHELAVVTAIRLPRLLLALGVGAALSMGGTVLQAFFRNPLADPGLIGVSSGAALAAVAAIVLGGTALKPFGAYALPLAAFAGALLATALAVRLARDGGRVDAATLLLTGLAVNAIAGAGIGLLIFLSNDDQLRALTFWTLGGLGGATWNSVPPALVVILVAGTPLLRLGRQLNALCLGEGPARHIGVDVERLRRRAVVAVALAVGAAVAVAGPIGFVGLVVPHLLRLVGGAEHRYLLPASALGGAALLLLADTLARTVAAPTELPVGLVTAAVGGPFFLWLVAGRRGRGI